MVLAQSASGTSSSCVASRPPLCLGRGLRLPAVGLGRVWAVLLVGRHGGTIAVPLRSRRGDVRWGIRPDGSHFHRSGQELFPATSRRSPPMIGSDAAMSWQGLPVVVRSGVPVLAFGRAIRGARASRRSARSLAAIGRRTGRGVRRCRARPGRPPWRGSTARCRVLRSRARGTACARLAARRLGGAWSASRDSTVVGGSGADEWFG
jgi:hypothetical protein